jgi:hypothetical protein
MLFGPSAPRRRALAGTDLALTPQQQTAFVKATAELIAAESVDAERPEAHLVSEVLSTSCRADGWQSGDLPRLARGSEVSLPSNSPIDRHSFRRVFAPP